MDSRADLMDSAAALRVAIVNDHELVVRGLAAMLAGHSDIAVVELDVGRSPRQAVDIVLYDTFANEQGNGAAVRALLSAPGRPRVVVYSWNTQPELVAQTLSNGVHGYLSKGLSSTELASALRRVAGGEVLGKELASGAGGSDAGRSEPGDGGEGDWPGRSAGLTAREAEMISLIAQGMSNQEIAAKAYLSINSVKSYIRSGYRRIGVDSRSKAVRWGIANGLALAPSRQITANEITSGGQSHP